MSSTFGNAFTITTWGESHGRGVGVVVDGCPSRLKIGEEDVQKELDLRKPGISWLVSEREERDRVEILSGIFEGMTTGAPISMLVWNVDVDSSPYERIKNLARPGHADLTYELKYKHRDWRGGGRASARETVGRVAGGAIAKKLLSEFGIKIVAYTVMIGGIHAEIKRAAISKIRRSPVRCPDLKASKRMEEVIKKAISRGDSVGGIIEVFCSGVPPGLGEPVFDKLDADLAKALMSIPAVKGVEIGDGFKIARLWGSQANDRIVVRKGKIKSETNHAGGILGGISSGLPLIARVAVKPTSSIPLEQQTIDMKKWKTSKIKITGRHDPCIVPRAVPVVEAMVALVLADHGIRSGFIPMVL